MARSTSDSLSEALLEVRVNGEVQQVPGGCTVAGLLALTGLEGRRIAVAINRQVVPRSAFASHLLAPGDRVEILEAVGGGA